jgi:DNA polymerase III alpha subunit
MAVLVAIISPGMMRSGNTERYLNRAQGKEPPTPPHPLLDETFLMTYGLMAF